MTTTIAKSSAAAAAVVAALLLTGCGSPADLSGDPSAPGTRSTSVSAGNPNEHRGHRDLQGAASVIGNPNEHLAHRGH
jgi:hypothetical protein